MRNKNLLTVSLITLTIILSSWGGDGHYIIGSNMTFNLPAEMDEFKDWNTYLGQHSSDPDYRKSSDPDEYPKHFIDIDNYTEFNETGSIPMDLDVLIESYGVSFVKSQGYLPWATITAYDSLVSKFRNRDWEKAKFYAADLSHYVADGFMPLHLTRNYDGQFTGNSGIHSRFESKMISRHKNEIIISQTEIEGIEGIEEYIFSYIYNNNKYVDSIMWADDYGKSVNMDLGSNAYLDAMWEYSSSFTLVNLNEGTKAFSSLFYAAWKEAGKPMISTTSIENSIDDSDLSIYPNPVKDNACIKFGSGANQTYELSLLNANGSVLKRTSETSSGQENVELIWDLSYFEPGMYILSLQNSGKRIAMKVLVK